MLLGGRERVHWEQMGNSSTIETGISDNIFDLYNASLDIFKGPAKFRYDIGLITTIIKKSLKMF